jgi:hypothetical protein
VDLNGGQWVAVVPYPQDNITEYGGVFQGPIYLQAEVPNNPAAFVTVGWVQDNLVAYLGQNGYVQAGNGVTLNSDAQILSIDSGLLV